MTLAEAIPTATGACLGLGALAKSWPRFPNAYIPTLVAVAGAVLVPSLCGWNALHVISGFVAGLGATGAHQGARKISGDVRRRSGNTEVLKKP
jgi:hypothetical protein